MDHSDCSSIPQIDMSHRMFMWNERKALQSSGLILCDSIEAAGLVEQTLFASNTSWKKISPCW
jgi:hypothetical protein